MYAALVRLAPGSSLHDFPTHFLRDCRKDEGHGTENGAAYKVQSGALSAATLDRATNAITYRVFGCEEDRKAAYEENLSAYESAAVRANIWNTAMPPIYRMISMTSILFILYFGGRNVLQEGWTPWNIAVFTTFLSCYTKLATKSSSAAKLFNAVHKAQVSWKRIKPLLQNSKTEPELPAAAPAELNVDHLHFAYPNGKEIIHDLSFQGGSWPDHRCNGTCRSGKSTLGKTFLCESPYEGSITFGGKELGKMEKADRNRMVGYLGHDQELFHGSVEENIRLGGKEGAEEMIRVVCLEDEVKAMENGIHTLVGTGGVRLSGGQAQRLAHCANPVPQTAGSGSRRSVFGTRQRDGGTNFFKFKGAGKRLYYNPHFPSPLSVRPDGSGHLDG